MVVQPSLRSTCVCLPIVSLLSLYCLSIVSLVVSLLSVRIARNNDAQGFPGTVVSLALARRYPVVQLFPVFRFPLSPPSPRYFVSASAFGLGCGQARPVPLPLAFPIPSSWSLGSSWGRSWHFWLYFGCLVLSSPWLPTGYHQMGTKLTPNGTRWSGVGGLWRSLAVQTLPCGRPSLRVLGLGTWQTNAFLVLASAHEPLSPL